MNILLVYATYSSGTASASAAAEETLRAKGHTVKRQMAQATNPEDFDGHDLIILASPSWQGGENDKKDGQPHIHFVELMKKFGGADFSGKSFAIFGLGDAHYARFCGAVDQLEDWIKRLGGKLITTSLRINKYYFDEENNNKILSDWVEKI